MPFRFEIPVRFSDVDHAKIVYYPRYLHYCHVAMEELFPAVLGVQYHDAVIGERVGYPTVRLEAAYESPVGFGERLELSLSVERLGTSSVSWRTEGRRLSDGVMAFVVRNTTVAVDMDAWKSIPIPAHHRRGFESLLDAPQEEE